MVFLGFGNFIENQKVAAESRALKSYKDSVERDERAALNDLERQKAAERKAFGRILTQKERDDFSKHAEARRKVKAERRDKVKKSLNTIGSDFGNSFGVKAPFDGNLTDDRYSKRSGAVYREGLDAFSIHTQVRSGKRGGMDPLMAAFSFSQPRGKGGKRKRDPLFDLLGA